MGRFVCLVPVLFARLSLAIVHHVTVKGLLYCIMLQKPQSCPKGPRGLFPKKMRGVGKDRVVIQWNPVNTTTFVPWKFGRINGVVVLTG